MAYPAITVEGGLLSADILDRLGANPDKVPGQTAVDFGIDGVRVLDEIQTAFSDSGAQWKTFAHRREREDGSATGPTRNLWMVPLFSILSFDLAYQQSGTLIGGENFIISHRPEDNEHAPPVHIVAFDDDLDTGNGRRSPHALVQEYLNRSDCLWGIVTNGRLLRLLRNTQRIAKPTYIEFDLEAIFEQDLYADFSVLWRLCHRSRLPRSIDDNHECYLEQYHQLGIEEGGRVRDKLRGGVELALEILGTGFLAHESGEDLRSAIESGRLTELQFYRQLLRLIYRLLFLMVAEERKLLLLPDHPNQNKHDAYLRWYSVSRLRDRAEARIIDDAQPDLWESLKVTFRLFRKTEDADQLGLTPLNGELFGTEACRDLELAGIQNLELLGAVHAISTFEEQEGRRSRGVRRRVNYSALDVEEFGSVYESLLDYHPQVVRDPWKFQLVKGSERKSTGSYYTPPALVAELIKSALEPVLAERLAAADGKDAKERAILGMSVCDPASGSGHFLLAAARRLGRELARVRSGEAEPTPREYRKAVRDVIAHCIYAVDMNPLAVDLCKVALWIEGHTVGMPLSFLDHRIKHGNSLIGVADLTVLDQGIPDRAYKALTGDDRDTANDLKRRNREEREGQRTFISLVPANPSEITKGLAKAQAALADAPEASPEDVHAKEERYRRLQAQDSAGHQLKLSCDLWCAAFFAKKVPASGPGQETVPTTEIVRDARAGHAPPNRMTAYTLDLALENRFFHWPLEFPEAFVAGGFDVMLGNPPWEVIQFSEDQFWDWRLPNYHELDRIARKGAILKRLEADRNVASTYQKTQREFESANNFFRGSGRYTLSARGKLNTYALFTEKFMRGVADSGRAGLIVPPGILSDDSTKALFHELVESHRLLSAISFENEEFLFPGIANVVRFALLTVCGSEGPSSDSAFAFFLRQTKQVEETERFFNLSEDDLKLYNPNTRTCPIFRSKADAELTKKFYHSSAVLVDRTGDNVTNDWGLEFRQGLFNMTSDRAAYFHESSKLKEAGAQIISSCWTIEGPVSYLPLYEGKFIWHHDHRFGSYHNVGVQRGRGGRGLPPISEEELQEPNFYVEPRYLVTQAETELRLNSLGWHREWLVAFRDMANAKVERTFIASFIPRTAVGHNLLLAFPDEEISASEICCLVANFSSIPFDYVARQKVGGSHLSFFIVEQLPVLSLTSYSSSSIEFISARVAELSVTADDMIPLGNDLGLLDNVYEWAKDRRDRVKAELDAYFAYLYGLTRGELRYILDPADVMGQNYPSETFRVLKNNEIKEFNEYRTRRLVLEAWDRFAGDGTFDKDELASRESIAPIAEAVAEGRSGGAGFDSVAVQFEQVQPAQPLLFVEGETDIRILSAAWSVFYPDEEFPLEFKSAGGTTQMGGLATRGRALLELIGDRVVCALADNDADGRALWNDGNLHKGAVWKQQTNGVNWCLLKPTEEFLDVMADYQVPKNCWPFTIESCFSAALRRQAMEEGSFGLAPGGHADLTHNPEVAQRMLQALPTLTMENDALFYLQAPDPEFKVAFADWVTSAERRTPENYAAFEDILMRLKAILDPATDQAA